MIAVKYTDLSLACDFVGSVAPMEHRAYIARDTGTIYWVSEIGDIEDGTPDDLGESDRYIEIPHKNDLDLGRELALRFTDEHIPDAYGQVSDIFGHRGAYRGFKDLLASIGALEKWYAFEAQQTDQALKRWCEANQIELVPDDARSA